jgi:hypothetical protein
MAATAKSQIPLVLPSLPYATDVPWSAEVVEAHRGLLSTFRTSRAALNLDESDPIRLGHHLKQAETFMVSIVEVLSHQTVNPLPQEYIETINGTISSLILGLRLALAEATTAFVILSLSKTYRQLSLFYALQGTVKGFTHQGDNRAEEWKTWPSSEDHLRIFPQRSLQAGAKHQCFKACLFYQSPPEFH